MEWTQADLAQSTWRYMTLTRMTIVLFISSIIFWSIACGQTHHSMATPRDSLMTVRSALRDKDLDLFKRTLSTSTLASLESEAKANQSVDDLLRAFLERSRENEETAEDVEEDLSLDENKVELRGKNGRPLGRFVKEGNEWKLDGFGWKRES